ncbi:MAG TPA: aminodeoxychorismate synthase component I [Pseudonocardiaceae bacterium]
MRTLLIDNYDSYTYNLYQLIARVNGAEPTVVRNDVDRARLDLTAFDNIVISPGPGHPARPEDFGICADVIATATIPLLGVCLGHQGIVTGEGGLVTRAPAARHGHLTTLRHDGTDLFAGLPETFTVVRYHSLCAARPLPATLIPTAWAEDGVIMALRHRDRPLWGLQFHPESVASEFGAELLARFRDRTPTNRAPVCRPVTITRPARGESRLAVRTLDVAVDTETAFTALFDSAPHAFWLDSAHVEPGVARFSHLGADTGPRGELLTYQVGDGEVTVESADGGVHHVRGTVFDYLDAQLAARRVASLPGLPFDPACGYVGYFGYELKADCGGRNKHQSVIPDARWIFADRTVTVDHETGRTHVVAFDDDDEWLAEAVAVLADLPPGAPAPSPTDTVEPWLTRDRARYLADIADCQAKLHAGESYELCLTNTARVPAREDGFTVYRRLRRVNPAPYGAYLRFPDLQVACSSPERFLRIDRDARVETKPIKGTIRRGTTPAEDARLKAELLGSGKNVAENLMILDLLRNDLGRVCEVGSVTVPAMMVAETYATVHQLVSTVHGRLRPGVSVLDCVRACFPGGSMTGAPKLRSMEILDTLETTARGVYSGSIGVLGVTGTADLNIVIRTAVLVGDEWHIGAGGAIVLDSDPAEEYAEMLLKASATLRAVADFGATSPSLPSWVN